MKPAKLDATAKMLVVCGQKPLWKEVAVNSAVVSDSLIRDDFFVSVITFQFIRPIEEVPFNKEEAVNIVKKEKLSCLDQRGIIQVGRETHKGDILVADFIDKRGDDFSSMEEKVLNAIFGRTAFTDNSLYYYFQDKGIVINTQLLSHRRFQCEKCGDIVKSTSYQDKKCPYCGKPLKGPYYDDLPIGATDCVKVEIAVRRQLQTGDVLKDSQGNQIVVSRIVSASDMPKFKREPIDIIVHPDSCLALCLHRQGSSKKMGKCRGDYLRLEKAVFQAEEKITARGGFGNISLISKMPIESEDCANGQWVKQNTAKALIQQGYASNLREMLSIKCDAIEGRIAVYESLVKGLPVKTDFLPESTRRLEAFLMSLCLKLVWLAEDGKETSLDAEKKAVSFTVRRPSASEIRSWSFGEVKKPDTINYRTYRPEKDGLFCERIFGPVKDYECSCGKYKGMKYKGIICDRCGVKITHSRVRRRRFGHIDLVMPVIPCWYFKFLAETLGLTFEQVEDIVCFRRDLNASLSNKRGPLAIKEFFEKERKDAAGIILEAIPVLPPELRPVIQTENGSLAISDSNYLYRMVINRNNRLAKLKALNSPQVIIDNEQRMLCLAVDNLFDNSNQARLIIGDSNRPLVSLADEANRIFPQMSKKRVEYSIRGIAIPDSKIQPGQVGLPEPAVLMLWDPLLVKELKAQQSADTIRSARKMIAEQPSSSEVQRALASVINDRPVLVITDNQKIRGFQPVVAKGEAIRFCPDDALNLGLAFGGEKVTVHLPLSQAAISEIREPQPVLNVLSAFDGVAIGKLIGLALSQESIKLEPFDRIILGAGGEVS